jgi:hypothetical protein
MAQSNSNTVLRDSSLALHDGTAITSTAVGSVAYLDVGEGRFSGDLLVNITAIDVSSTNETYRISLQGSTTSGFSTGIQIPLFEWSFGDASTISTAGSTTAIDTTVGLYRFPVTNELLGLQFRYLRVNVICGGTTPSVAATIALVAPSRI